MEELREKLMELMMDESKLHFTNILWSLPNFGQLIWRKDQLNLMFLLTSPKTFQYTI